MGKGKAKGLPKELLANPNLEEWRKAMLTSNPDEELMELYGMFKKCAGKDKKLSRAEFLKNFTKKVTVTTADGKQPVEVADVEKLFNACAIDYNYDDVSVHEFITLMTIIRGTDADKKLKFAFIMHDKDNSGALEKDEVRQMLSSLLSHIEEKKRDGMLEGLMKDIMVKKDLNRDGKIQLNELQKAVADLGWMKEHLGKGVKLSANAVADKAFQGASSSICLIA